MIDTNTSEHGIFPKSISKKEASDTGMAMVLICLIAWFFTGMREWTVAATALLVLNMTAPMLFKPVAFLWLGLSGALGAVMSRVILGIVFFGLVTPLALLRRVFGHDPMALRQWKKGEGSVFVVRDHSFSPEEIERPF